MAKKQTNGNKWIQKAVSEDTRGDFKAWCKRHGFSGVNDACISAARKAGGRAAHMANFAQRMRKMARKRKRK
jgi:hypothetical protein